MADSFFCCGTGALAKLAMGKHGSTATRMDFNNFHSLQIVKALTDGSKKAIRGTLDHLDTNPTEGLLFVKFRVSMWVTAAKMAVLLPMMGLTAVSSVYTLGDTLPECDVILGPPGTKEHTFSGCIVSDWVVQGQKGSDPIEIDIGFIGATYAGATNGTFFTSQSSPAMTEGYVYPMGTGTNNVCSLNALGQTVHFPQFRLAMNYHLLTEYNNSVTATNICPSDHELTFATSALYSSCDSTEPLFDTPFGGDTSGASLTLNLTRTLPGPTTHQTQFVVANMKAISRPPNIKKTDFNRLPINLQGYATSSTALLVVTNS